MMTSFLSAADVAMMRGTQSALLRSLGGTCTVSHKSTNITSGPAETPTTGVPVRFARPTPQNMAGLPFGNVTDPPDYVATFDWNANVLIEDELTNLVDRDGLVQPGSFRVTSTNHAESSRTTLRCPVKVESAEGV